MLILRRVSIELFLPLEGSGPISMASQPVRWAEQAPNYISSSKNQGDNRRRM